MHLLSFQEALAIVEARAAEHSDDLHPRLSESVSLTNALGRVLAQNIAADRDQPAFDRATRDGFALYAESTPAEAQAHRTVVGEIRAGEPWTGAPLGQNEAAAIMTGAPLPPGANAVVMVEHVHRELDRLVMGSVRTPIPGQNIVPQGAEAKLGQAVVAAGTALDPAAIAMAASCGCSLLSVVRQPRVAIVPTGDELVDLAQQPLPWQIRNSNGYGLAALVTNAGAVPEQLPSAPDLRDAIRDRIRQSEHADLLLLSGGVSMGKYDLVEDVLREYQAEFFFTGVQMQPGKPVVFGRIPEHRSATGQLVPRRLFFGLPGNPISTEVTFHCFVAPLLRTLCGEPWSGPAFALASLDAEIAVRTGLTRVLPARLTPSFHRSAVCILPWQGSGDLAANTRANCYAVLPDRDRAFQAGETITVLLR